MVARTWPLAFLFQVAGWVALLKYSQINFSSLGLRISFAPKSILRASGSGFPSLPNQNLAARVTVYLRPGNNFSSLGLRISFAPKSVCRASGCGCPSLPNQFFEPRVADSLRSQLNFSSLGLRVSFAPKSIFRAPGYRMFV